MKWIILFVVLIVMICEICCYPAKIGSTDEKRKTNKVTKKSSPQDNDDDYDSLLKALLASKLDMKGNDDDDDGDDISNFISNLQETINKNDNSDDDDDDMSTMLDILAMQSKDMFDSDKTIKKQYWGAIFRGGYRIYKYCRSHPKSYYCRKGKQRGRKTYKKIKHWFG